MTGQPEQIYWADGAGSRAVFDSLQAVLTELRGAVLSDRAIAMYRPDGMRRGYFVLSDSVADGAEPALGNEKLMLNQSLNLDAPATVGGLEAKSTLRPFHLGLGTALSIPWQDAYGRGVALIGVHDPSAAQSSLDRLSQMADATLLANTLHQSRMSGTLTLQRQLSSALRAVLDGGVAGSGRVGRLTSLVSSARQIFGSDTAYLALPEESDAVHYYFASMTNVSTPQFRQLRMRFAQGLGGLARREGRPVRSSNYADDERLLAPPVNETVGEGILSAMAAPLLREGKVEGVLYIGSHTLTPYSETDQRVLEEFADYVSLLMRGPGYRSAVQESRSTRLREDFAHAIHDSVVRSLVQIGFTAEQVSASMSPASAAKSITQIQNAAEEALTNLREELSGLALPSPAVTRLGQVVDQITDVPVRPGLTRNVFVQPVAAEQQVPAEVAEALVHVGAESLTNSMVHSRAANERVEVKSSNDAVELLISDDGVGSPVLALTPDRLAPQGHFGLASMYRRAAKVNGQLEIASEPGAGTTVRLVVPRAW